MTILYIVAAILGIGLIIFIHECGHFFAAKKVGVRVERFALGFDPKIGGRHLRLFCARRGETEYVIGAIPFGGYVKMAGEILPELDGKEPKEDELQAKGAGARALVFAAGALMNIFSAFFLFMIAFTLGVPFTDSRIGNVVPGSAAWNAGLRAGDQVVAIDGRKVVDFSELALAAAFGGEGDPIRLQIRRDSVLDSPSETPSAGTATDATSPIEISVTPEWSEARGLFTIGAEPALDPVLEADPPAGTPAARAGLARGDVLVGLEIAGQRLPSLAASQLVTLLATERAMLGDRPARVQVERDGKALWLDIPASGVGDEAALPLVRVLSSHPGAAFSGTVVRAIAPHSSARTYLNEGDNVASIDGRPAGSLHWLHLTGSLESETPEVRVVSIDGKERTVRPSRDELLGWALRGEVEWVDRSARVGTLEDDSPLAGSGLAPGDVVWAVDGQPVYTPDELTRKLRGEADGTRRLTVHREGERLELTVPTVDGDVSGVRWTTFCPLAVVFPGGPADRAGLTAGSRVTSVNGEPVFHFDEDFTPRIQAIEPGNEVAVTWIDASGDEHEGSILVGSKPLEPSGLEAIFRHRTRIVRVGLLQSFSVGVRRTVHVGKQVLLTLRSLLRREVSAKNLAGPIGITHILSRAAAFGLASLIYFMAMISVNLGLLNLMPFPILDGGHLLFLAIEKIKGSPVDVRVQEWAASIAFFLIIAFALFVTFHDVRRLVFW